MSIHFNEMIPRILEGDDGDEDTTYDMVWQGAGIAFVFVASLIGVGFSYFLAHMKHQQDAQKEPMNVQHCEKANDLSDNLAINDVAPDHVHAHNHDIDTGKDYLSGVLDAAIIFLKGIGIGIIISVALVHLINEAYEPFRDAGWAPAKEGDPGYEAWPMVFAIIGIFLMALIEFIASTLAERSYEAHVNVTTAELNNREMSKKKRVALMVEFSILSHSILIGFDLGLQFYSDWKTLVIAVCFHQFFEGIALAQVVGDAKRSKIAAAAILLGYCLITPIGIGIGMGTMSTLPPGTEEEKPQWANVLIGIVDGLCGGVLLYVGLLNLLVPWFMESKSLKSSKTSFVYIFLGWFGIALGLAIMCVIGIWA